MSTIQPDAQRITVDAGAVDPSAGLRRRGILFWIIRYLPAEIVGTAAMLGAGLGVGLWTDNAALIAVAALVGEIVGFYLVLGIAVAREQRRLGRRRLVARTLLLLVAEFGAAELIDTFLVRPMALILGVWLVPDPVLGLLVGKIAADVVFYAIAAGAFTITDRTGLRRRGAGEGIA